MVETILHMFSQMEKEIDLEVIRDCFIEDSVCNLKLWFVIIVGVVMF